jgi:hypothetical protein
MDTQNPGLSVEVAGEAVEAATPEIEQRNESQQIETTEVGQVEAQEQHQDDSDADEGAQANPSDALESKSQRQRRLKRERTAERERKLAESRRRLKEIEEREAQIKDPSYEEVDDMDRRAAIMAANEAERRQIAMDRKRLNGDVQSAEAEAQREYTEKADKAEADARTRYTDYDAKVSVLTAVTQGKPNRAIVDALRNSDAPADLAYFLGNNPEEAARIHSLPELSAAREIGRLEAGLSIPKPKTKTNTPPPIKPIQNGGSEVVKNPEEMSFSEYEAARKAGKI